VTHEHEAAGRLTADLGAAVEVYLKSSKEMGEFLVTTLRSIAVLYPGHIWKENYLLFPMTDKILSEEEQQELAKKFESVERKIGLDVHHRLEQMAATLAERAQGV
jgi:hemerythrin-like domain-containing protein